MEESPHAAQVWRYLQGLGCTRTVLEVPCGLGVEYRVVIRRAGEEVGSSQHTLPSLANSGALLAAVRQLGSRDSRQGRATV